jgi:hypothetical protein
MNTVDAAFNLYPLPPTHLELQRRKQLWRKLSRAPPTAAKNPPPKKLSSTPNMTSARTPCTATWCTAPSWTFFSPRSAAKCGWSACTRGIWPRRASCRTVRRRPPRRRSQLRSNICTADQLSSKEHRHRIELKRYRYRTATVILTAYICLRNFFIIVRK